MKEDRGRGGGRELLSEAGHHPSVSPVAHAAEAAYLGSPEAGPCFPSPHPRLAHKYEAKA